MLLQVKVKAHVYAESGSEHEWRPIKQTRRVPTPTRSSLKVAKYIRPHWDSRGAINRESMT